MVHSTLDSLSVAGSSDLTSRIALLQAMLTVQVAAAAAETARLQRRNARNQVPIDILAFLVVADLVAAAGGAAVGPSGVSASARKAASASGRAAAASGRAAAGAEGQGPPGDCQPAPFTEVFSCLWVYPLRILPASSDRPKPAKSCLRVSAAPPVPYVPPPLKRRSFIGRAVLTRRAR
jgi:hypothetical protein